MTFLNYELGNNEYESVIISGLAVLEFQDDRGWLNTENYTIVNDLSAIRGTGSWVQHKSEVHG
jgi:hypothetical protein